MRHTFYHSALLVCESAYSLFKEFHQCHGNEPQHWRFISIDATVWAQPMEEIINVLIMSCAGLQLFPFCPEDLNIKHTDPLYVFEQVVCRACSRNRYPLKYLKDRMAKVCDHCYAELRKRGDPLFFKDHSWERSRRDVKCFAPSAGGSISGACGNSSPRTHRAGRPLSAVFQSLQPPSLWKSRKSSSNLSQVANCCLSTSLFATICSLLDIRK